MQVTTQQNTHDKRVTALIGMLHTVFCILFTLHQSPSTLRGTAAPRVVMNSNQKGVGNGKSWVLPVANLDKCLSNLNKYSGKRRQAPVDLPRCEALEGIWSRLLL